MTIVNPKPESELTWQARIQTGLHRFTEIGQIFQMTQNGGKYKLF